MKTILYTAAWIGLLAIVLTSVLSLRDQRDAALQRAAMAELSNAELLGLLNGHTAMIEVRNGAKVYTVFKTSRFTVRPLIFAEAQ